jgi:hypothetical protein
MTVQEVKDAMRVHRWSLIHRMRKNHTYIYAARKVGGQRKERYIAPLSTLETLTLEALVEKLQVS